jgi:anaerobic selenocysteine-containing dehydrogenase
LDVEPLRSAKVVVIAAHEGPLTDVATVTLPATSWAEHSGTYVNAKGMRQLSEKALEPQGSSRTGWAQVAAVAATLGYEASWTKVKHIRARLAGGAAPDAPTAPPPAPEGHPGAVGNLSAE